MLSRLLRRIRLEYMPRYIFLTFGPGIYLCFCLFYHYVMEACFVLVLWANRSSTRYLDHLPRYGFEDLEEPLKCHLINDRDLFNNPNAKSTKVLSVTMQQCTPELWLCLQQIAVRKQICIAMTNKEINMHLIKLQYRRLYIKSWCIWFCSENVAPSDQVEQTNATRWGIETHGKCISFIKE